MECALCQSKICLKGIECDKFYGINLKTENIKHYSESDSDTSILNTSSEIPKNISRIEEISNYIDFMGIKVVGIGFCIGHDILFSKYSESPVTTLVVKDRVNKHCPTIGFISN